MISADNSKKQTVVLVKVLQVIAYSLLSIKTFTVGINPLHCCCACCIPQGVVQSSQLRQLIRMLTVTYHHYLNIIIGVRSVRRTPDLEHILIINECGQTGTGQLHLPL